MYMGGEMNSDCLVDTLNLAELLVKKNYFLSVAESCTGGLLSNLLTNCPGSSEWFKGGIIAYSNEIKRKLLNVEENILQRYGAVSKQCVLQMVEGLVRLFNTEVGISISGIAGPGGGSLLKPVGTVFQGFWIKEKVWVKKYFFTGSRIEIKEQSVKAALTELITNLL
ncbi:nicotinamide-nucleotide amidase [Desulfonauticus submarinus]|uniref:Nicotinamide-nucleotide amidase n=2 Tax=Desulfonauticus submarinus TaxID=206665 RepID=A0A1H0E8A4_9BACT|nr:nicotinamide-nucleotide amidase [Desulfonauticus submarinus]